MTVHLLILILYLCAFVNSVNVDINYLEKLFHLTLTQDEKRYRSHVLSENLDYINRINSLNYTYELGITSFSHLTLDEFMGMNKIRGLLKTEPKTISGDCVKHTNVESFDWRRKGVVSPIQNQLTCGCCYAFAAAELVSVTRRIHGLPTPVLSAQQLVDCSITYGNNGCKGGSIGSSLAYIRDKGLVAESVYPYYAKEGVCQVPSSEVYSFDKWDQRSFVDESTLKDIVVNRPVSVGIVSNWAPLQHYRKGVLSGNCDGIVNHVVIIVGFDSMYCSERNEKVDYWIMKNSWGPDWGENGYLRMERNYGDAGMCQLTTTVNSVTDV